MPDLSQYTNEELFEIAGIKPPKIQQPITQTITPKKDLSIYSDEELFKIAGLKPKEITEKPLFLPRYQRTQQLIEERPKAEDILMQEFLDPYTFERLRKHPFGTVMKPFITGLKMLNVPRQRIEAGIANPLMAIQEEDLEKAGWIPTEDIMTPEEEKTRRQARFKFVKKLGEESLRGLRGEKRGEFGDVPRQAGVPEPISALIGFGVSVGLTNLATRGRLVASAKRGEAVLKSKTPKVMNKNYALDRAKLADKGLDDLYEGLSKEYDSFYNKISIYGAPRGEQLVNKIQLQNIIDDLPPNIATKIAKSNLLAKFSDGSIAPTLNNIKIMKGIIRQSVPDKIWNGKAIGDVNTGMLEQSYHKMSDLMARNNPELTALNKRYRDFMQMRKTVGRVLYDADGNVKSKGLENLFKPGAERSKQIFFEQFAKQWPQAGQIIKDMIKFSKRQELKAFGRRTIGWGLAGGGTYYGLRKGLRALGGEGGGGGYE